MSAHLKRLTDYLLGLGIDQVPHTEKTYLGHLVNVYRLMEKCGCTDELCRAGMFHSIYGTQQFQGFKLPLEQRPEVRELIGARAEQLAYLNCAMDRPTFDRAVMRCEAPYRFTDRLSGAEVELPPADFEDLCRVHLFDWLEQAPRSRFGWDYRRAAYRRMAERLGPAAVAAFDQVYAAAGPA
jgi:hypothetical protein